MSKTLALKGYHLPVRSRRALLRSAAAFTLALTPVLVSSAASAEDVKAACLFTQSVSQGGWDPGGYAAFTAMANKYKFQTNYVEMATYEKAPAILRDLASKGTQLIITHSSGYSAAIEEVAPKFPNTQFVLYSWAVDTKGIANYSAWSMNWDQYGYLVGALAASASAKHHIALVVGEAIPSEKRTVDFVTKGAKAVDGNVQVDVVYVGSFTDVAKAKEIAQQAIERGADFVVPLADTADAGTQQAAEETGAMTMGEYVEQGASYPKSIVSSSIVDFNKAYDQIGQAFIDKSLNGKIRKMGLETHDFTFSRPFKHVKPEVETMLFKVLDDVASGKVDIEK